MTGVENMYVDVVARKLWQMVARHLPTEERP